MPERRCSGCRKLKNNEEFQDLKTCKDCRHRQKHFDAIEPRLRQYKASALRRNLGWDLSDEYAKHILKMPCLYCSYSEPNQVNGIDRLDNTRGYTEDNTCSCCSQCNYMKGTLSAEEFISKCICVARMYRYLSV